MEIIATDLTPRKICYAERKKDDIKALMPVVFFKPIQPRGEWGPFHAD